MSLQDNASRIIATPRSGERDEPCLSDMISDPIVRMLMGKDKLSRSELLALIAVAQHHVGEHL